MTSKHVISAVTSRPSCSLRLQVLSDFMFWSIRGIGSITSHYFHIGDCHEPNSRGLYTHCKDSY